VDRDFDELRENLAAAIRAGRSKVGLSQEALALSADVDRTYVSQLERGIANPSLLILFRIAEVLNTTVPQLLASKKG